MTQTGSWRCRTRTSRWAAREARFKGTIMLQEWVGRANIRLEPRRLFHDEDTVVVEQAASGGTRIMER